MHILNWYFYFSGIVLGYLFASLRFRFSTFFSERRQRKVRRASKQQILALLETAPDGVEDERVACPLCWEQRHLGEWRWSKWQTQPCVKHAGQWRVASSLELVSVSVWTMPEDVSVEQCDLSSRS